MPATPKLKDVHLQALCDIVGDTCTGLTGSEIGRYLDSCSIPDPDPSITKRHRLFQALRAKQEVDRCAATLLTPRAVLSPCCRRPGQRWQPQKGLQHQSLPAPIPSGAGLFSALAVARRSAATPRARARPALSPGHGAFADQLPLELGQRREDAEHEAAGRGRGVDLRPVAGEHPQAHPASRQVLHGVDEMGEVSGRGGRASRPRARRPSAGRAGSCRDPAGRRGGRRRDGVRGLRPRRAIRSSLTPTGAACSRAAAPI